ncbi:MAG: SMI1/KNR4 family protein [Proteobacteria bacterium]|nr:SMI1/KNR4 family protein [Pseudomonadota bacterium]
MNRHLIELIKLAQPICDKTFTLNNVTADLTLPKALEALYEERNGMRLFNRSLIVYPLSNCGNIPSLFDWNSLNTWKSYYGNLDARSICFAEDIFGGQFCLINDNFYYFDVETAELELISSSLDEWAYKILNDRDYLTGFPLSNEWQLAHGEVSDDMRLIPKIPFFLGGEYKLSNLYLADRLKAIKYRAEIYQQTKSLPDGESVELKVVN